MDHLREGIHLRAMGQRDPASEWQREGFELFSRLSGLLGQDFLRYVMRIQVTTADNTEQVTGVTASGPESPVLGAAAVAAAAAAGAPATVEESTPDRQVQKVNTEWEATPRNAPCPCGSGRKFKHCHGS